MANSLSLVPVPDNAGHSQLVASASKSKTTVLPDIKRFFLLIEGDSDHVRCNVQPLPCTRQISVKGGGSTNKWNHLKSQHRELYETLQKEIVRVRPEREPTKLFAARQSHLEVEIARFVACSGRSINLQSDPHFSRLVKAFEPQLRLPEADSLEREVRQLRESMRSTVQGSFDAQDELCLTISPWNAKAGSFAVVSAHFLTESFEFMSVVLAYVPLSDVRGNAGLLCEKLRRITSEWKLDGKVSLCTAPGADVYRKACELMKWPFQRCFLDVLDSVLSDTMKSPQLVKLGDSVSCVAAVFHNNAPAAQLLQLEQRKIKPMDKPVKVKRTSPLKCGSLLDMLLRVNRLRNEISLVYATQVPAGQIGLDESQWTQLHELSCVLQIFEFASALLSRAVSSLSVLYSVGQAMLKALSPDSLEILGVNGVAYRGLVLALLSEAWQREFATNDIVLSAVLFHPDMKDMSFLNGLANCDQLKARCIDRFTALVVKAHAALQARAPPPEIIPAAHMAANSFASMVYPKRQKLSPLERSVRDEVMEYLAEPTMTHIGEQDKDQTAVLWWRSHARRYPSIAAAARVCLAQQATASSCLQAARKNAVQKVLSHQHKHLSPREIELLGFTSSNYACVEQLRSRFAAASGNR